MREEILKLVLNCAQRADVFFDNNGEISVTLWKDNGKIDDVFTSYNYSSMEDFFNEVKCNLKQKH